LLYIGQAEWLRQRKIRHFYDNISAIRHHREGVYKISIFYVEDRCEREIYGTYIINKYLAKYNIDKVFYK